MTAKAIIFDISTKRVKADGGTNSELAKIYAQIGSELKKAGFDKRIQHSVYRSSNGDGVNGLLQLLKRKEHFPLFCKYKERIHWMSCDDYSDVTDAFDLYI
jgi:virulence-associated protein VapD